MVSRSGLLIPSEEKPNKSWTLLSLDWRTGKLGENIGEHELPLAGDPLIQGDTLYFATQNGHLRAYKPGRENPSIWTI